MGDISTLFVKQFNSNLEILSQQKGSKLRNCVRLKMGVTGEDAYIDQVKPSDAKVKTTRHADVEYVNNETERRKVSLIDIYWADLIDKEDKLKMLADPTSEFVMNAAYSLGRKVDDLIITAAFDTAYYGKAGGSSETFDTTNNRVAEGGTGLTVAKILSAKEILDNNDVDEEEPRFMVVTGTQIAELLNTTEVKSADYNTVKALAAGQIDTFCGFKFVKVSTSLLDTTGSDRRVIAFAKNGLGLAMAQDLITTIDRIPEKHNAIQILAQMSVGATRLDMDKVVDILCLES